MGIQVQHCRCVGERLPEASVVAISRDCVCGVYEKASRLQFVLRLLSMIVVLYPQILSPPAPPKLDEIWLRKRTVTHRFA